ncbi:CRTAC1 family protein [Actinomadura flavalba]|uniref:CRTAC1 family protein n=1 Tax=Actinomadura flavalba TaxID=1120938 RepID=UPI0003663910|nr:CRTAC1 family protein [Actinomadura flavalba]
MPSMFGWLRRQLPGVVAVLLVAALFVVVRLPGEPAAESDELADKHRFTPLAIALPSGFKQQTIRRVNKSYSKIDAWISSVGAGIAMNDLDGDGLPNDLCVTDPRIDQVAVTPAPGAKPGRYEPFALDPAPLPMGYAIAPMGCAPADFNEDGRMDLLVYFWGRSPILYLAKPGATKLDKNAYVPTELVPGVGTRGYAGPQWNSNAVALDDFDGDGHLDIYLGNYFPDGPVLDDRVRGGVKMNRSLSNASNGGEDHVFRWTGATKGANPTVKYEPVPKVIPEKLSKGWVLAAAANDLNGDGLPELYLAQDHGKDALLFNTSVPGRISFSPVKANRTPGLPKSKRLGVDSFKGMGIDFGDFNHDGMYDMFVSNITTSFGIQESNYQFVNDTRSNRELTRRLHDGEAPWTDRSSALGTAWSGWGWDVKIADFVNSGEPAIAQTTGFVKGRHNRWPQLQELAASNDLIVEHPGLWPNINAGDDIAGSQRLHFFVKNSKGRYSDLAGRLGINIPVPTRGIAVGDVDGDGRLEMAVARQWDAPVFYKNDSPGAGNFLGLRLQHDDAPAEPGKGGALGAAGSPAVGAQVMVTTADGRKHLGRVDGGSGHGGKRSSEVHIGLGDSAKPVAVMVCWRDRRTGAFREQKMTLAPGWHTLRLGAQAKEK